ncbi:MAG: hypothetical protein ABL890_02490 [Candidatus Peribacteraceae bacterium]
MDTHPHTLLSWTAKAKVDHERGNLWYVIGGGFCGFMIVYSILTAAYTQVIVFLLLPGALMIIRRASHKEHTAAITDAGFMLDGALTPWNDLDEFWILRGSDYFELHISQKNSLKGDILIQTGSEDPMQVRDLLLTYVKPGIGKKERIVDALIRFCKL